MANYLYLRLLWMILLIYKSSAAFDRDSFNCDFEDGFCNWKQDGTDDFNWTRHTKKTDSEGTEPDADHTSGEGFYMYIETTLAGAASSTARLISPQMDSGQYCFSFWYHMYGSHINSLSVSKMEDNDTKELFLQIGNRAKQWLLGQMKFVAENSFQIVIEGKARDHGVTWYGDIAVDDIQLLPFEECNVDSDRHSLNCSFDDGFCNWEQVNTDDFDWNWISGSTPTSQTGPALDHTSGDGHYVYIETTPYSNGLSKMNNYEARLISPKKDPGKYCFSFWYHMYGSHINRLRVSKQEGTNIKELFTKFGEQEKKWIMGRIHFGAEENFQIIIEGKARNHGDTWYGDIAIDDVVLFSTEKCPTDCGDPITEPGVANATSFEVGSSVQIICKPGYKIADNSTITCLENGSWLERPVCKPIECEAVNITNGHFNTALGTTFGKTATQFCDSGYTLAGDKTVTCLEAGWNGSFATCTIIRSEANVLVIVYAAVPVIVIVLTLVLLFFVCRKRHMQATRAKCANYKPGRNDGLRNQDHVSELSEPVQPDEEYSCITNHNRVEPTDAVYYNILDNTCKIKNDEESQYDHTNVTSKSFSDNVYSHISGNRSGITDETTYDTTLCQNSRNESLHTKAQIDDDSYSHFYTKSLDNAAQQKIQTTIQAEEESEYANTTVEVIDDEHEQNEDLHQNELKETA